MHTTADVEIGVVEAGRSLLTRLARDASTRMTDPAEYRRVSAIVTDAKAVLAADPGVVAQLLFLGETRDQTGIDVELHWSWTGDQTRCDVEDWIYANVSTELARLIRSEQIGLVVNVPALQITPAQLDDLTAGPPPLAGMELHHGMWVSGWTDDGDLIVYGHQTPLRAIAAMNSYGRSIGADYMVGGFEPHTGGTLAVEWRWGVLLTVDDCEGRAEDPVEHERYHCEMCATIEGDDWWMRLDREWVAGALPITYWGP